MRRRQNATNHSNVNNASVWVLACACSLWTGLPELELLASATAYNKFDHRPTMGPHAGIANPMHRKSKSLYNPCGVHVPLASL